MNITWHTVTRSRLCTVCEKPDWCGYSAAGDICMRIQSNRPTQNGGWLHNLNTQRRQSRRHIQAPPERPTIDAAAIWQQWHQHNSPQYVQRQAETLGVSEASLNALGCVYSQQFHAAAFPMRDGGGNIIGLRLRNDAGKKWAVKGSRSGIFLPDIPPQEIAFVTEGPTDTAAAISLGLYAIGRPSNSTGGSFIREAIGRAGIDQVVIVCDNDKAGVLGANRVAGRIGQAVKMWTPPGKDLRKLPTSPGMAKMILQMVGQMR
jgi:hypothetical protein